MSNSNQFGFNPLSLTIIGIVIFFLYRSIRKNKKNAIYILMSIVGFSTLIAFMYIILRNTAIGSYMPMFIIISIIILPIYIATQR
ncbi:MAG: hypothetical protein ACYCTD_07160, partial [bacterium]